METKTKITGDYTSHMQVKSSYVQKLDCLYYLHSSSGNLSERPAWVSVLS
jgi:hypothetical protein